MLGPNASPTEAAQASLTETEPESVRKAAWATAAQGDLSGAERLLEPLQALADNHGEAWFNTGLLRLARGDHEAARAAFIAAAQALYRDGPVRDSICAQLEAYDPEENRFAAAGIFYSDYRSDFFCFTAPTRIRPEERQHYGFCFDRIGNKLGAAAGMEALLDADLALNGKTLWFHTNQGHRHWLKGDRAQADAHYAAARAIAIRDGLVPYHFNCGTLVWLPAAQARALIPPPAPKRSGTTVGVDLPRRAVDMAVVVGCDAGYFKFLPNLVFSTVNALVASGESLSVVLYCALVDLEDEQKAYLYALSAELERLSLGVYLDFTVDEAKYRDSAWYTCLRYLALPQVLTRYDCPVFSMDIDCELQPSFFTSFSRVKSHAFGFRMYTFDQQGRQDAGEPWSIGAHPTYIGNSDIGRRFAGFLGAYIRAAYDPTLPTNWTIDQCAIAQGYDLLVKPTPGLSVVNFAHEPATYRLPEEFGGKAAFLEARGVTMETLIDALRSLPG